MRYDQIELRREKLVERLHLLREFGAKHSAYGNAEILLSRTFRKAKLTQRVAILDAATWLIELIEKLPVVL